MKHHIFKTIAAGVKKQAPSLLMGAGIAGMITTTILAVRATPKALKLIEEKKAEEDKETLTIQETVQAVWKCYIPSAIVGGLGVVCLIESGKIHGRRNAALATVYSLSESALREYQEKVVETIGEQKEKSIRESIDRDRVEKNPPANREVILTGKGDTLCYDVLSGRYFKSDIDRIKKAVNELNRRMLDEMTITLNEYYTEIGLEAIEVGYDLCWDVERGLITLNFSSQLTPEGTPCLVISHAVRPLYYR